MVLHGGALVEDSTLRVAELVDEVVEAEGRRSVAAIETMGYVLRILDSKVSTGFSKHLIESVRRGVVCYG
jgi:hypothetical protein